MNRQDAKAAKENRQSIFMECMESLDGIHISPFDSSNYLIALLGGLGVLAVSEVVLNGRKS